ncbi:hypothetical protein [Sphingomonas sp.]|uniref:hypothetical protein n=1 Tax=Sphingomonas sp. TaxID=28214 RepID=UPI002DC00B31|nr:hypothetical protein [Sphingomonas sp.]HEU4970245.1 hypothetical protein [Sphingomonas sp.]
MSGWPFQGTDPSPLQRPRVAGAIAAGVAAVPAAALVWLTGSARMPATVIGVPEWLLVLLSIAGLAVSGGIYGSIFLRAANDRRGGWLFGLGWGFLTWTLGPITLFQWWLGRPVAIGTHAAWLLAAHLLWGLLFGAVFPLAQNSVKRTLENAPSPREVSLHRRNPEGKAPQRYRRMSSARDGG